MSNKNTNQTPKASAIGRIRERNTLKKQRIAVILMSAAVLLLIAALLVVSYLVDIYVFEDIDTENTKYYVKKTNGAYALYKKSGELCDVGQDGYYVTEYGTLVEVDPTSGECSIYAVVDTEGTEVQDFGQYVLLFKQLTYDAGSTKDESRVIKSIEVHNSNGGYTFLRDEKGKFVIKGSEGAPYSAESFAQLAVACGYTLSTRRLQDPVKLPDGSVDYAEYGLAQEKRVRVETDEAGNEKEIEYDYIPAWYIITTMTGESHKVTVGDKTVAGTGYYARYEGRDTIYVIGASAIEELLLGRVESFIVPTIVYPMGMTDYFNVSDFVIYDSIDYESIYKELYAKFSPDESGSDGFKKEYERLFAEYSRKVCDFYYADLSVRQGTMNAYVPYISNLEYAKGYYLNSTSVDIVLGAFYQTDFGDVVKLSPSIDELKEYGLAYPEYVIMYLYKTENEKGEEAYVENFVDISKKDGVYYAYSSNYDMIVTVEESSFSFLEWEEIKWYDTSYIQLGISNIDKIIMESQGFKADFVIDDSASKYLSYIGQSGNSFKVGDNEYKIIRDGESGKYLLYKEDKVMSPSYTGDYLITPITYKKAEPEAENYLFAESEEIDRNDDGNTDGILYYFYDVVNNGKEFCLVAQLVYTDLQGNQLTDSKVVWGKVAYSSEYFCTNSGYLYFARKDSAMGADIEEKYGKYKRGNWGNGNLFVTSSGEYVLVDSESGAWVFLDDVSCGLYLADKENSRLSDRAVEIPAKYDDKGNILRYPETYYPMTDKKIQYNADVDKIQSYNKVKKVWENMTYNDCTIGMWNEGNYYVVEGGLLIVVNSETGDWGEVEVLSNPLYVADVFANGERLDYTVVRDGVTESSKLASAMQNFQELYKGMLNASFEGMAEIDAEKKAELAAMDDFSTESPVNPCILKITVIAKDFYGNERNTVYRFYRYSERHAYITIETLETDDTSSSDSEKAYGNFYVLYSFAEKMIADANRVLDGETVVYNSKY